MVASVQLLAQVAAHVLVADLAQAVDHVHRARVVQVASEMVSATDSVMVRVTAAVSVKALAQVEHAHRVDHALRVDHVLRAVHAHRVAPLRVLREHLPRSVKVADVVHHQQ